MSKESNTPFSLDTVEISNFRLFGKLKTKLHPELTVFIAPNSGGKTGILDAISLMLRSFMQPNVPAWQASDVHRTPNASSNGNQTQNWIKLSFNIQNSYLAALDQNGSGELLEMLGSYTLQNMNQEEHPPLRLWLQHNSNKSFGSLSALDFSKSIAQLVGSKNDKILPLVAYFSANRRVDSLGVLNTSQEFNLNRATARLGLLPCINLHSFDDWLRERAITGLEERLEMEEMGKQGEPNPDTHLKAVSTVLAQMLEKEVGVKTVKYFSSSKSIQAVKENGERFDIEQLSHGAKSILMIAAKLAMNCCALNPHLRDQAPALTPGIILIDEIDLHLHPKWQQHVIGDLQRCFPKMQFIISTHSPAVLSTVKKENIREIQVNYETGECSATEPLARSYGESIADTLETIMDVSARPDNELVRNLNDYLNWAENGDLSEDKTSQRNSLEKELGKNHSDLLTADLIIRRREILAEKK